jgi:diguanylate cyclase (GGDEF)-like protein
MYTVHGPQLMEPTMTTLFERDTVLIVEDSTTFSSLLQRKINKELGLKTLVAVSLAETRVLLDEHFDCISVALLDLNLPDAPDGEVIAPVLAYGIPAIVFTGTYSDEVREAVLARNVVDYITKESSDALAYLLQLIMRLQKNRSTKVLVVDDSASVRLFIMNLLRLRNFKAFEAENGERALELLDKHPDIKLVIVDYYMPGMDGFELTRRIRTRYSREKLAIIGISAQGSGAMSAQFLKKGANDFLVKPFVNEEFFCRIEQNLEVMEYIEEIHFLSRRDYLTGLGNRRHFFDAAPKLLASAKRDNRPVSVTMLDIDHFKKVNDTYGHDGGDAALRHIALILREFESPRTLVARFGGEEFCILLVDDAGDASQRIENLRQRIASAPVTWQDNCFSITVSLGHLCALPTELESMLATADALLYRAKQNGRNRVEETRT